MHCYRLLLAPFALVATLAMPAAAQAPQSWTQVGALSCQVDPNVGFIIVGSQSMRCLFTPNTSQEREAYAGALNTVGLNVGISAGGVLGWAVFAPTAGLPHGALAGEYVGVSGDVGIGLGAGANVLLGGSNRTVALQPISLQGSIALNVVAGVSSLKLRPLPL
jgi:predicted MFS family arabinose efflux permease